jgi:hypothetical protein
MTENTTHIMLVSDQAAANLLPALDPMLKPAEAVLMVSGKMQHRAQALEAVLHEAGVKTTRVALEDEHDYGKLESAMLDVATTREGPSTILNVTGGTKLMALAAQAAAIAADWRMFYVDVDTDEVIWLGKEAHRQPLTQQLRLRHYLHGYGFRLAEDIAHPQYDPRYNDLLSTLITQVGSLEQPIAQLNWLGQKSEDDRSLRVTLTRQQQDSRSLDVLLRIFADANVLTVKGDSVTFTGEAERSFAKGGWLEHHTFKTLGGLSGELSVRDKAANLVVLDENDVKNELDIAFMAKNRLFVIECKTARMDKPEAPKANDTLFKLSEICRRVGGLGTRGMLASYRPLAEAEKRLAEVLRIELVCGAELIRLDEKIKNWVRR